MNTGAALDSLKKLAPDDLKNFEETSGFNLDDMKALSVSEGLTDKFFTETLARLQDKRRKSQAQLPASGTGGTSGDSSD